MTRNLSRQFHCSLGNCQPQHGTHEQHFWQSKNVKIQFNQTAPRDFQPLFCAAVLVKMKCHGMYVTGKIGLISQLTYFRNDNWREEAEKFLPLVFWRNYVAHLMKVYLIYLFVILLLDVGGLMEF
jgi:hypothetical protein